jgi:phosphatidylinositol alpha 1,6-mannosyltransferase
MIRGLRIALFSGNYNYVRDGANQALNRLVDYLEQCGATVRVYSPTTRTPAFEPKGTLVSVPSFPMPGRNEYRVAFGMPASIRADVIAFKPDIIHLSAPDLLGRAAQKLGHQLGIPCIASVHTRFETYLSYYRLGWLEKSVKNYLRRFYRGCAQIFAPSESYADLLQKDGCADRVGIWGRGVNAELFSPTKRSEALRESWGVKPDETVILFVGRLVLEKGIDQFARTLRIVRQSGRKVRPVIVGEGPAQEHFARLLPEAFFAGFMTGEDLAHAYASADIFFNPSVTEAFGNVTLEAMASGIGIVCAHASGSSTLVSHGRNGLVSSDVHGTGLADALIRLIDDPVTCAELAQNARKDAMGRSWNACLSVMATAYAAAANRKKTFIREFFPQNGAGSREAFVEPKILVEAK